MGSIVYFVQRYVHLSYVTLHRVYLKTNQGKISRSAGLGSAHPRGKLPQFPRLIGLSARIRRVIMEAMLTSKAPHFSRPFRLDSKTKAAVASVSICAGSWHPWPSVASGERKHVVIAAIHRDRIHEYTLAGRVQQ